MEKIAQIAFSCCLVVSASICGAGNGATTSSIMTDLVDTENFKVEDRALDDNGNLIPVRIERYMSESSAEHLIDRIFSDYPGFSQIEADKFLNKDKVLLTYDNDAGPHKAWLSLEYIGRTGRYELAAKDKGKYYPHVDWVIVGATHIDELKRYIKKNHMLYSANDLQRNFSDINVMGGFLGLPGESQSAFSFSKITGRLARLKIMGVCDQDKFDALYAALKETYATKVDCIASFTGKKFCKIFYKFPLGKEEIKKASLPSTDFGPRVVLDKIRFNENLKVEYVLRLYNAAGYMVGNDEINKIIDNLTESRQNKVNKMKRLIN